MKQIRTETLIVRNRTMRATMMLLMTIQTVDLLRLMQMLNLNLREVMRFSKWMIANSPRTESDLFADAQAHGRAAADVMSST
jgi:hypothetical protein